MAPEITGELNEVPDALVNSSSAFTTKVPYPCATISGLVVG